jgi:hypothetical protein
MKITLNILFIFVLLQSSAQNLVPNPSFELFWSCPSNYGQTLNCQGWNTYVNTADFHHACSTTGFVDVPNNSFSSYQPAATGSGYFGFIAYGLEYTEFFGRQLSSALVIGQEYFISFKVNCAIGNIDNTVAVDKLGLKFFSYDNGNELSADNPLFIDNSAHIYSNQVITDTINWTTISGSFVADSAYEYFMIGQFFDSSQVQKVYFEPTDGWDLSYYYVDDVCVSLTPNECYDLVGVNPIVLEDKILIKITDFMGRETERNPNVPLIYFYSDGSIEKVFQVE